VRQHYDEHHNALFVLQLMQAGHHSGGRPIRVLLQAYMCANLRCRREFVCVPKVQARSRVMRARAKVTFSDSCTCAGTYVCVLRYEAGAPYNAAHLPIAHDHIQLQQRHSHQNNGFGGPLSLLRCLLVEAMVRSSV
jgi:hypothetical protein